MRELGLITEEQLESALQTQRHNTPRRPLGEILVEMDAISAEQVSEVLAESIGVPYVRLIPEMVHPEALSSLPEAYLEDQNLLPLTLTEGWLTIAVERFTDVRLIEDIARQSGCRVQVIAAEASNIRETRSSVTRGVTPTAPDTPDEAKTELDDLLSRLDVEELSATQHHEAGDDLGSITASDSPVIKLVNYIIQDAVQRGASDIHIEPQDQKFRVRCRVDGELVETIHPSSRLLPAVVSRIKIIAGLDISEKRLPQDGSITVTLAKRPVDLRVSTMTTKIGEKVVMRIVDRTAAVRSLDALGFEAGMLAAFRLLIQESHGIVIVTGPTGSGKTTTLYAALSEIVSAKSNVSTIEDPVERLLGGTNQFQVNPQAGFTFARALRSLLRQDPDVLMVGEIRDAETAKLATEAALTGHLVLTTLHTNDAPAAVPRLVNMGVEPYLVAASLRGVLAQRLVRRVCPDCRRPVPLNAATQESLAQLTHGPCPIDVEYRGTGCMTCRHTGFIGRVGVYELLALNEEMLGVIARDPSMRGFRETARSPTRSTLFKDGLNKVRQGLITVEGVLEIVSRTDELANGAVAPPQPDGDGEPPGVT